MTTDIDVAARRAEIEAELAELDAVEARQAADNAVETLTAWMADPASVDNLSGALVVLRDAVVATDPAAWPNGPRQRTNGDGKAKRGKAKPDTRAPFDAAAVLDFLKGQSEPVGMRTINAALGMGAKAADLVPLGEAGSIVITGKAPQFRYAVA